MLSPPDHPQTTPAFDPDRIDSRHDWGDLQVGYVRAAWSTATEHRHPALQVIVPFYPAPGAVSPRASWRSTIGHRYDHALERGDCCLFAAEQPHTVRWRGDVEQLSFYLTPAFIACAAHDLTSDVDLPADLAVPRHEPLIWHLGLALRLDFLANRGPTRLHAESLGVVLAVHLLRLASGGRGATRRPVGGLDPRRLGRALDYIDAHLTDDLPLVTLAAAVGLSPYHFGRAFKAATGQTPHQYLLDRRIARAQELLRAGESSIADVAASVGFRSQSHLTTLFRRRLGITPWAYRNTPDE